MNTPLERCRRRKAELLRECDANRATLAAETRVFRTIAWWVRVGVDVARFVRRR
jgi:hypothetical protein